jgi:hypothetical protein
MRQGFIFLSGWALAIPGFCQVEIGGVVIHEKAKVPFPYSRKNMLLKNREELVRMGIADGWII